MNLPSNTAPPEKPAESLFDFTDRQLFFTTALLGALFFGLYLAGAPGSIPSYRDSGDFIASIHGLGIAHPPGYALYIVLGRVVAPLLTWGNAAYRINIFSSLLMSMAMVLLFYSFVPGRRMDRSSLLSAVLASVFFATRPATIDLSRVAEIYALATSVAAGILVTTKVANRKGWYLSCLLWGLGLSAHPTLVFLAPLYLAAFCRQKPFDRGTITLSILFLLTGLAIFLFMPIRAHQSPDSNWGDPEHWRTFWRVVTRADYGGLKLHPAQSVLAWNTEDVGSQLLYFSRTLWREWQGLGLSAAMAGLFLILRRWRRDPLGIAMMLSLLVAGPFFFILANLPLEEPTTAPILQTALVLVNLLGSGAVVVAAQALFERLARPLQWILGVALVLGMGVGVFAHWSAQSHRRDFAAYDYGRNVMRSLPPKAVLYDPDDPTAFTVRALQTLEGRRKDLILLNFFRTRWGYEQIKSRWPDLLPPGTVSNAQDLERIFWSYSWRLHPFYVELPQTLEGRPYEAAGLVYASLSDHARQAEPRRWIFDLYAMRNLRPTEDPDDFYSRHLSNNYAAARSNCGMAYSALRQWTLAESQYKLALLIDPELAAAYNNWAIVRYSQGDYRGAVQLYRRALSLDRKNRAYLENLSLAEKHPS